MQFIVKSLYTKELQSSSTENGDLNGEDEVARLTAELTAEAAAHAISIANLRSELTLQSDKAANFEATASKSQASLAALQDELKTSKKQYEVSAVVAETAKAELTKLESVHAGQNVESEKAIAGLKSDAAALILRISELQESLTAVKEKEAHSEETLSVARLNQGRLEELQEMLTNVREELRVAKLKEAAVNPLEEQLVDAIEELERERLERDQALSTCLAAATEKHNAVIAGLKSKHSLAMAAQEEELKIEVSTMSLYFILLS